MTDCVFCPDNWDKLDIVKTIGLTVHEPAPYDWYDIAIVNPLDPVTEGHVLVIAGQHSVNAAANQLLARELMYIAACYVREQGIQANIITSIGPAATQTVMHTHVHVVPRTEDDGLPLPWTPQHEAKRAAAQDREEFLAAEPQASEPPLILEKDIRIDVYSSGALGNTWTLRLTHVPTGIVIDAMSEDHKSQLQGRVWAFGQLQDKLMEMDWTPDAD